MFVRAHRKRMEYIPSGSGARESPDESEGVDFIYYAEMSFLVPHYKPRMTRSNMKTSISKHIPSSTSASVVADSESSIITPTDLAWNTDLTNSMSIANIDDSCFSSLLSVPTKSPLSTVSPTSSPMSTNETFGNNLNQGPFVPFSPSILPMNSKGSSGSKSGSGSCGTFIASKFKSKAKNEVVPPSDTFCKQKKIAIDSFLGETSKMMDKMVSTVETVVLNQQSKTLVPEDNELTSVSVTIAYAMKDIPKAKRRIC
ncbi:unnamed protein product [Lasius platythorax]|uniref:Uncharacterized protein n=2 Tax=Lasius platythorax TaxID=488582 RepID=A0AAV2NDI2_9HYME